MRKKHFLGLSFIIALLFSCSFPASAQIPVIFQQGFGGYEGTHDTFYQTGDPGAIHGAEDDWEWDNSDAGGSNYGFIYYTNNKLAYSRRNSTSKFIYNIIFINTIYDIIW